MYQADGSILVEPYTDEEIRDMMEEDGKVTGYVAVSPDFVTDLEYASERELRGDTAYGSELEDELAYMVIPDDYAYAWITWSYSDLEEEGSVVLEVELSVD